MTQAYSEHERLAEVINLSDHLKPADEHTREYWVMEGAKAEVEMEELLASVEELELRRQYCLRMSGMLPTDRF